MKNFLIAINLKKNFKTLQKLFDMYENFKTKFRFKNSAEKIFRLIYSAPAAPPPTNKNLATALVGTVLARK